MHVDVLVSTGRDGAVHCHSGPGSRAQALLWQLVAGAAQDEQPARVEGKPDLVGVGDAPVMTWGAPVPEMEGDRLVAGQQCRRVVLGDPPGPRQEQLGYPQHYAAHHAQVRVRVGYELEVL